MMSSSISHQRLTYPVRWYNGRSFEKSTNQTLLPKISISGQIDDVCHQDMSSKSSKKLPKLNRTSRQSEQEVGSLSQSEEKSKKLFQSELSKLDRYNRELRNNNTTTYLSLPPRSIGRNVSDEISLEAIKMKSQRNFNGRMKVEDKTSQELAAKHYSKVTLIKQQPLQSRANVTSGSQIHQPNSHQSQSCFSNPSKDTLAKRHSQNNLKVPSDYQNAQKSVTSAEKQQFLIAASRYPRSKTAGHPFTRDLIRDKRQTKSCHSSRNNQSQSSNFNSFNEDFITKQYKKTVDVYMDVAWQRARKSRIRHTMKSIKMKHELEKINENRRKSLRTRETVKRQQEQLFYVRNKHLEEKEKRLALQHVKWKFVKKNVEDRSIYGLPNHVQKHRWR